MAFPLFLDESVDARIAALLRKGGFDVLTTGEAGRANQKISDEDQLKYSTEQHRVLVSPNARDFLVLTKKWQATGEEHAGMIVYNAGTRYREVANRIATIEDRNPEGIWNLTLWA